MATVAYIIEDRRWCTQVRTRGRDHVCDMLALQIAWGPSSDTLFHEHVLLGLRRSKRVPQLVDVSGRPHVVLKRGDLVDAESRTWTRDDVVLIDVAIDIRRDIESVITNALQRLVALQMGTKLDPRLTLINDDGDRGYFDDVAPLVNVVRQVEVGTIRGFDRGRASATYSQAVAASTDDAQVQADGANYSDSAISMQVSADTTPGNRLMAGSRHGNAAVLAGTTINAAVVNVVPVSTVFDDANCDIFCEDADNPATFSSGSTPIARTRTSASSPWVAGSLGAAAVDSADFSNALQEWADRPSAGSNVVVLYDARTNNLDTLRVRSWDHSGSGNEPRLDVTYTAGSANFDVSLSFSAAASVAATAQAAAQATRQESADATAVSSAQAAAVAVLEESADGTDASTAQATSLAEISELVASTYVVSSSDTVSVTLSFTAASVDTVSGLAGATGQLVEASDADAIYASSAAAVGSLAESVTATLELVSSALTLATLTISAAAAMTIDGVSDEVKVWLAHWWMSGQTRWP